MHYKEGQNEGVSMQSSPVSYVRKDKNKTIDRTILLFNLIYFFFSIVRFTL